MLKKTCNNIVLLPLILLFVACNGAFVPDPIDPRLPKYTEEGNNVAGALIGDEVWSSVVTFHLTSPDSDMPKIYSYPQEDSLTINFFGSSEVSSFFEFQIHGPHITQFSDLTSLNDQIYTFNGTESTAFGYSVYNYNWNSSTGNSGQIYFRKVSLNEETQKIIFSGTFGFSFEDQLLGPLQVRMGRFDYALDEGTFNLIQF